MVLIDHYAIMPNHVHILLHIDRGIGRAMRAPTVSNVINQLKGYVTKQIGHSVWQKLFYDHVIRDDEDYRRAYQYIAMNPLRWEQDEYFE